MKYLKFILQHLCSKPASKALKAFSYIGLMILLSSCSPTNKSHSLTIIIGSWYGFYPIYYALEKGFDKQHGLRIKVLEPNNLKDFRRSYLREQVDFVASSMLEFTYASTFLNQKINPVLITDYSNGGDVIIARKSITSTEQLYDKRIGVPSKGIGEYVLSLVFDDNKPSQFFEQFQVGEGRCEAAFHKDIIDACVTYPPISTYLLKNPNLHKIYTSAQHPRRIFDILWSKEGTSTDAKERLKATWFATIKEINQDPKAYYTFVAKIASVSTESVEQAMKGIKLIDSDTHEIVLESSIQLSQDLVNVCTLVEGENCYQFANSFNW